VCPRQVRVAAGSRTVTFPRLRGRNLRAGTTIVIRATRPGAIGTYIRYRIGRNRLFKRERCLDPGRRRPRRC
jgi:hypothetical protein